MRGGDKFKDALRTAVEKAASGKVRVGIIQQSTYEDGQSVAQVAYWNEYGTAHIPPRPFFRQTIAEHKDEWSDKAAAILRETDGDTQATLAMMGEGVKGQVVETIQNFRDPPNAPSTERKKGFNKPLIDTGTLWRSIDYEMEE
ncbi:hypothetical protein LVJ85_05570 [Neisseria sp. Dent CA1/247]|uniref:hypothetical protein n=1 Tax=Neisseria sp. Dent CA1/247 TaxID=2912675 RepID=UPI001FD40021|nr:hypothetical protein [Neisseria sp. Dent CA1/247]UOO77930.1 hypothetical protein LVJ85_05570 [Neisseria sp. Dent CA1/247]